MKRPALALTASLLLCGCAGTPRYAGSGTFLGERIDTQLDSPEAVYYLGSYLDRRRLRPELDARIDRLHQAAPSDRPPSREELATIAREFSTDFAALFFADRVARDRANANLQARFRRHLDNPGEGDRALRPSYARYLVLFAPGWDYRAHGHFTGADFARPRRLLAALGLESRLIEFDPHGSAEANAALVQQAIAQARPVGKRILVVGASSAGPSIHLALSDGAKRGAQAPAAWVNLGGILQGSPLIDHFQGFPRSLLLNAYLWIKGWKREAVSSLGATRSRERMKNLRLPDGILVINYVGLSLSGSLSRFSKDNYLVLRRHGPNDGFTPLADIVAPRSLTLIAPNSDHFFAEDPRIDEKTIALAKCVISLLEDERPGARAPDG